MDALQQAIAKLLTTDAMMAGTIKNSLNGQGWDVSEGDVLSALRHLEGQFIVECLWRIKETPIQT